MSTTRGRRIAPRRSYWSTKSPHEVAFHARYVELILDSLMKAPPEKRLWCRHARKHLDRSREEREKQVWKGAPPGAAFLEAIDDQVRDEAMWSIARILDQLYSTQEFGAQAPGPMLVADDRYFVHRASAALPAPGARSALTLRAWSHLHRASLTADSEEAFDEAWKVLEIMTGKASTCGAGLIAYFPLIKAPRGLKKLLGADRDAFVKSEYRENLELFEQIADIRNRNVVHRNIARADWHVLEQHAAVAISFARDAVQLAITAWKSPELAAREPAHLMNWLETAYKSMSITLPKQNDLTPE